MRSLNACANGRSTCIISGGRLSIKTLFRQKVSFPCHFVFVYRMEKVELEGLRRLIVVGNKRQDPLPRRRQRREVPTLECPPHQDAEPDLDLIEPRRMF